MIEISEESWRNNKELSVMMFGVFMVSCCHGNSIISVSDMDVFQTDWKEKHESRGTREPPTLLNVWHGYLGEEDESTVLERINVPTIFHPDQGNTLGLSFIRTRIIYQGTFSHLFNLTLRIVPP